MENGKMAIMQEKGGGIRRRPLIKPIESSKIRKTTFLKRRAGLMKKAMELQTLCDVPTLVLCFNADDTIAADVKQQVKTWPEDENQVLGLVSRYARISPFERSRWRKDPETLIKTQIDKTRSDIQRILEEYKGLLDAKIQAVDRTIPFLLRDCQERSNLNNNIEILIPNESSALMDLYSNSNSNNNMNHSSDDFDYAYDYDMFMKGVCDKSRYLQFKNDNFHVNFDNGIRQQH